MTGKELRGRAESIDDQVEQLRDWLREKDLTDAVAKADAARELLDDIFYLIPLEDTDEK